MTYVLDLVTNVDAHTGKIRKDAGDNDLPVDKISLTKLAAEAGVTPKHATLQLDGIDKVIKLPVVKGSDGFLGIDTQLLRSHGGVVTRDPGYRSTALGNSEITHITPKGPPLADDPEGKPTAGILRHRGIRIEELVKDPDFLDMVKLLWDGKLPGKQELTGFKRRVKLTTRHLEASPFGKAVARIPVASHPMEALASLVNLLGAANPESSLKEKTPTQRDDECVDLLANVPVLAAALFRRTTDGQDGPEKAIKAEGMPKDLSYVQEFLYRAFGPDMVPPGSLIKDPKRVERAFELLFALHADHEQNCSTATARQITSSGANTYAAVAGAVNALSGDAHGGANERVLNQLTTLMKEVGPDKPIDKVADQAIADSLKTKKQGRKVLYGFGHRVYGAGDPRGVILKKFCDEAFPAESIRDPLLTLAKTIEEKAYANKDMRDKGRYPNVDFYSGILYKALGLEPEFFTVMFALGRLPGWIAHIKEQKGAIFRPRQNYTGAMEKEFIPRADRAA